MNGRVVLKACPSYQADDLKNALDACFAELGDPGAWIAPGERVLCKANLLMPASPERAITTHPEFVRAVIHFIRRAGGVPLVADNPAALGQNVVMRRAGIHDVLEQEKVERVDLSQSLTIENPAARYYRHFEVSKAFFEVDLLLNLPKLKTHALTYMTLAVKNLFGLIPGLQKARWHVRAQSATQFSWLLVDLYGAVLNHLESIGKKGRILHLLDGVLALQGEGPAMGGVPKQVGVLMLSQDAVALDRVACQLVQLEPERLLTCTLAEEVGLGTAKLEEIELRGDDLQSLSVADFAAPKVASRADAWPMNLPFVRNRVIERPLVKVSACTGCARCQQICPAHAITIDKTQKIAIIDYHPCIRCYCCCEVCPEAAMNRSNTPLLGKLMGSRWAMIVVGLFILSLVITGIAALFASC